MATIPSPGEAKRCECGKEFIPKRNWQKFCGAGCRQDGFRKGMPTKDRIRKLIAALDALET